MDSLSNALVDYYDRERATLATAPDVRAALRELGVARVQAEYDGVGDSGQIEQIQYLTDTEPRQPIEVNEKLNGLVEALLYALLNLRHGSWEDGEGAFGDFCWCLADGTIEHEHNERYIEHENSFHEGFEIDSREAS